MATGVTYWLGDVNMTEKDILPPIEKMYEAFSAIADGRVELKSDTQATVTSSDRSKQYTITWIGNEFKSNDNATYWQGYIGYPIVAVLVALGKIKCDTKIMQHMAGLNWKAINKQHKSNYKEAVEHVLSDLIKQGIDIERIKEEANSAMHQLESFGITLKKPLRSSKTESV
jgi:hypothetical protein